MGTSPQDSATIGRESGYSGYVRLYLPPEGSGVPWMFNPLSTLLADYVQNQTAGPDAPAVYEDFLQDAAGLKNLLGQRHIAVVLDPAKRELTDRVVDDWVRYLHQVRPDTRAGCIGSLGSSLGHALRDAHLFVRDSTAAPVDKARRGLDPGPAWEVRSFGDTRIVRIRTLDASSGAEQELTAGAASHAADFRHRKIVVDLRGNGGGDDEYVLSWMAPYARAAAPACRERTLTLGDGTPVFLWNYLTYLALKGSEIPDVLRQQSRAPAAGDKIRIRDSFQEDSSFQDDHAADRIPGIDDSQRGSWDGEMIVVVDGGTGSSGESAALMLRAAFGAVIVGAPSYGIIDYGNSVPYFLPASGLEIHLPSQANDWGVPVDFTGIQPDLPVPVDASADWIASEFDVLVAAARTSAQSQSHDAKVERIGPDQSEPDPRRVVAD